MYICKQAVPTVRVQGKGRDRRASARPPYAPDGGGWWSVPLLRELVGRVTRLEWRNFLLVSCGPPRLARLDAPAATILNKTHTSLQAGRVTVALAPGPGARHRESVRARGLLRRMAEGCRGHRTAQKVPPGFPLATACRQRSLLCNRSVRIGSPKGSLEELSGAVLWPRQPSPCAGSRPRARTDSPVPGAWPWGPSHGDAASLVGKVLCLVQKWVLQALNLANTGGPQLTKRKLRHF